MAQWNKNTQDFLNQERTLFEVFNIADHWGQQTNWVPQFTGKNRFKVSPYQTVFFNTFQYGLETDVWETDTTGTASAVHNPDASNVTMSVGSTAGDKVIRQTRQVMRYIPGRASLISFAIRLETPVVGVRRRFGVFDGENGAYFEDDGGTYSCVLRSKASGSVVETRVTRDNWNGDKLDGNGYSQITADPEAVQMINIEYEWYGAGQVIFSYTIDGETHAIHKFNTANRQNTVWCSTPFLPIRVELENVTGAAGTHYIYQGSNSLTQEGEPEKLGTLVSYSNDITGTTLAAANTFYPVLSLRLKSSDLAGIVLPRSLQVASNDNTNVFWRLVENSTLTGPSWTDHPNPDAITQIDTTATASTGGVVILSGFTVGGGASLINLDDKAALQIGRSSLGTVSDIYTLECASPNTNKDALAVLNWLEQR
ncbi:virion structural protein [Synechococcus phage S-RIM2]|uniref:Virion structural protein n=1 Tax=Synechococcus phage S-RIM2 TaxID=687800 RepID=A0A1D7RC01_9CAUD|nr:virion structural protein [Synechococcus phage S-RIM2]AOO03611.1 virion structural protein [Synechococcus phage S-RIM2]